MKKEYQFYDMMGYTTPFQREFFGYFTEELELLGGEPLALSRGKANAGLELVQAALHTWGWLRRSLPYVEMVCLTGEASFNTAKEDIECGIRIITNQKRMRSTYIMIKTVLFFINLLQKRNQQIQFRIDAFHEQGSLSIQGIKEQEFDIIPIYQLAHLSLLYQKHPENSRSIFQENIWIKEYLPNFPLQFVIACGIQVQEGKTRVASFFESLFSHILGDVINKIAKRIVLLVFMIYNKTRGTTLRILDGLIRRDIRKKEEVMLSWKVLRKNLE